MLIWIVASCPKAGVRGIKIEGVYQDKFDAEMRFAKLKKDDTKLVIMESYIPYRDARLDNNGFI